MCTHRWQQIGVGSPDKFTTDCDWRGTCVPTYSNRLDVESSDKFTTYCYWRGTCIPTDVNIFNVESLDKLTIDCDCHNDGFNNSAPLYLL